MMGGFGDRSEGKDFGFVILDLGFIRFGILDFGLKENVRDKILGYGVYGKRQKNQNKNRPIHLTLNLIPCTLYHYKFTS